MANEEMLFNPWVQFGLGLLGGNRGPTKGEALANAFGMGQNAIESAQRIQAYNEQVKAQREAIKMREYSKMKLAELAQKMRSNPKLDPNMGIVIDAMESGDPAAMQAASNVYEALMRAQAMKMRMGGSGSSGGGEGSILNSVPAMPEAANPFVLNSNNEVEPNPLADMMDWRRDAKGNLYRSGVKTGADQENYFFWRQAGNKGTFEQYMAQRNKGPELDIQPEDYGNWLNDQGQPLREKLRPGIPLYTKREAIDQGYTHYDKKEVENIQADVAFMHRITNAAENLLGDDGVMNHLDFDSGNVGQKLSSTLSAEMAKSGVSSYGSKGEAPWQIKLREYTDFMDSYLTMLSRGQGQVGVLTDADLKIIKKVIPDIGMPDILSGKLAPMTTKEVISRFREIKDVFNKRGIKNDRLDAILRNAEARAKEKSLNTLREMPTSTLFKPGTDGWMRSNRGYNFKE